MNKNILILFFLALMIAAAIYSVTLFNKVEEQKKLLGKKEASLSSQLDSNKILKAQLADVLKLMRKIEPGAAAGSTAKSDSAVKKVETELKNINEASIKLNEPAVYEQAKNLEQQAFEAIANNQFETALVKFNQIEKITPSFHSSYEIAKLLTEQKGNLKNTETQEAIKQQIVNKYSWKAPVNQLEKIQQQVKQTQNTRALKNPSASLQTDTKNNALQLVKTQNQVKPAAVKKSFYNVKGSGTL